eukprot:464913-Pyramimonas_sp.AAC.1
MRKNRERETEKNTPASPGQVPARSRPSPGQVPGRSRPGPSRLTRALQERFKWPPKKLDMVRD